MKLLLDVNISPSVAARLRSAGHDAVRATEVLDARASDASIVATALGLDAVVVTRDQDFSMLVALSGATRPSIINLRVSAVDASALAALIEAVVREVQVDLQAGAIVTVDDARMRVRTLPLR